MTATSILPPIGTTAPNSATTGSSSVIDNGEIASNFTEFLQLLTTQLQNQNPLDPLDTNQFTQQLVQFAQVEQQMNTNSQLQTLVTLQQTAQSTAALSYVGADVVVDGSTSSLANGQALWNLSVTKPATATVTIRNVSGQTAFTGTVGVNPGTQTFKWDGRGANGVAWPDGNYTLTATAVDASGQATTVSTEIQAPVDSVDLTQNPPVLSVGGQNVTLDKVKRIVNPTS
ncbi:MAG TPA: flagellar hook capping FlgD N-terminal domain-containing protein [Lacipirellulaceae bacterium]|nr:flagellar hook capping FlgD N-terminal domain-containing protein [Lacipirellulaceae bacterium]